MSETNQETLISALCEIAQRSEVLHHTSFPTAPNPWQHATSVLTQLANVVDADKKTAIHHFQDTASQIAIAVYNSQLELKKELGLPVPPPLLTVPVFTNHTDYISQEEASFYIAFNRPLLPPTLTFTDGAVVYIYDSGWTKYSVLNLSGLDYPRYLYGGWLIPKTKEEFKDYLQQHSETPLDVEDRTDSEWREFFNNEVSLLSALARAVLNEDGELGKNDKYSHLHRLCLSGLKLCVQAKEQFWNTAYKTRSLQVRSSLIDICRAIVSAGHAVETYADGAHYAGWFK